MNNRPITCYIYRSDRKADYYLYLSEKDQFDEVPAELLKLLGQLEYSFSFELTPGKTLAKENAAEVYQNLHDQGYHLQIADDLLVEQQLALKSLN